MTTKFVHILCTKHISHLTSFYYTSSFFVILERLTEFDKTAVLGFNHVNAISVPEKSFMSFRFAKHKDKTEEELILDAEARRADCVRGGRNAQKIRKELNGLTQKLVRAKSQSAKRDAQSNLVKAIEVSTISNKKRGKSRRAGLLGLLAYHNNLDMDSDIISSLSSALDVNPTVPRMTYGLGRKQHKQSINSKTGLPGALKYNDGRAKGSGMTSVAAGTRKKGSGGIGKTVAAGTRKQQINSVTKQPGAKKSSNGRKKGSGRSEGSDKLDEAFSLMQTTKYKQMKKQSHAKMLALEEAGFEFDKSGKKQNDWKDQYGSTLHTRRTALNTRLRDAKEH